MTEREEILQQIACVTPANEAEVETKILLHIFRLLGYTDTDRADKPTISMFFGHEKKQKIPDFIFYDGPERTLGKALVALETKAIGESLENAKNQVISYACWAGTPFYVVCNGDKFLAAQFIPAGHDVKLIEFFVKDIVTEFKALEAMLQRSEVILVKERLAYITCYLPEIEKLPPNEFFNEYLSRLLTRFNNLVEPIEALRPPNPNEMVLPKIPVTTEIMKVCFSDTEIAQKLLEEHKALYIQGEPGSGKSTLCKRITNYITKLALNPGSNLLPIYINLSYGMPDSLDDALKFACDELGVRFFPALYKKTIERLRIILILDGLDEYIEFIEEKNILILQKKLEKLICECDKHSILLTSRPIDTSIDHLIMEFNFNFGYIRKLTDEELYEVLRCYLNDSQQIRSILDSIGTKTGLNLHSPLMALMVIRVATEYKDWELLNTFTLFEKYVGVLHTFFNAYSVRGYDIKIDVNQLLEVMSTAALIIKDSLPQVIKLESLIEILKQKYSSDVITALLNTGIITSNRGKASFIHKSFEDFGLAWLLIFSLRSGDLKGFTVSGTTDSSYAIANTAITEEDEAKLRELLSAADVSLRRRAMGILKHGCTEATLNIIRQLQFKERSVRVWSAMGRLLVTNKDYYFLENLTGRINSRTKLQALSFAMRNSDDLEFLPIAIKLAESNRKTTMITCAFELALKFDDIKVYEKLIYFYNQASISQRESICSIVGHYRFYRLGKYLTKSLLNIEQSPKIIICLLNIYRPFISEITMEISNNIQTVLNKNNTLKTSDCTRLKRFISYLLNEEILSEPLQCILDACQYLLQRQTI